MRRSSDPFPQPVTSVDELLAIAHRLACDTEDWYRSLAERMRLLGDTGLTLAFARLAEIAGTQVARLVEKSLTLLGHAPDPVLMRRRLPGHFDEEAAHSALLTPYQALASAVADAARAFAFHTYIAAQAPDGPVRSLAEELATEKLHYAALLRQERRRASRAAARDREPAAHGRSPNYTPGRRSGTG